MKRLVVRIVFSYAGLAVAHWASVAHWLRMPPGSLWCGNVVIDPLAVLLNQLAPGVAISVVLLRWSPPKGQRFRLPLMVLPVFIGTVVALILEIFYLHDHGFATHSVWWLPGFSLTASTGLLLNALQGRPE